MKNRIALLLLLLVSFGSVAQRNRMGMQPDLPQSAPQGPTPEEQLDKLMVRINEEIQLDGLQEAAIRNIFKEQMQKIGFLQKSEMNEEQKREEMRLITEKTDKDIMTLLSPDQAQRYEKFKQDMRSGKSSSKKKKKKDKSDEDIHE